MKNIMTAMRLIAVHLRPAASVASEEGPVAGRDKHPRPRSRLALWTAALALVIALLPVAASAQEDGTVTISGTFSMDYINESDLYWYFPDLVAVYYNGHEHTWTLTLHGTTQTHVSTEVDYVELFQDTEIHATSFELEFFGPDAATLNRIVSEHLAGRDVWIFLRNHYLYYSDNDNAEFHVVVGGRNGELGFSTHQFGSGTLFPTDADSYPVVSPIPFSIETGFTELGWFDMFSGTGGAIGSLAGLVTIEGSVGETPVPPTLRIADGSVVEGHKGTRLLNLTVTLSSSSTSPVTVTYATANVTAVATQDYTATKGTLTFQPGVTSRAISISVKGDRKREPNETFLVQLSNAAGATIADGVATVTILNDD
ncbi:MAG: hypothetical protein KIS67_03980 [Verrucomicrobiae bacterium]|nr:hypothetical protein [Verrucomicrobiae bacterium]